MKLRAMPVTGIIKRFMNEKIRNTRIITECKPNLSNKVFYDLMFKGMRALYIWEQSK